jgi:hypothetical protein
MDKTTQVIATTALRVGDIAYEHGAAFEIVSTGESRGHIDGYAGYGLFQDFVGPSPVAVPVGRFIGGKPINGYFGPGLEWVFQGNKGRLVTIRAREVGE